MATVNGTRGNDNDMPSGGPASDPVHLYGGNDSLLAGDGDDTDFAGPDNDMIVGGSGSDTLYGGAGDDRLSGGTSDDLIYGGIGDDTLMGDEGADSIAGEAGDDKIYGGAEGDTLAGGTGDDMLDGGTGNDTIYGGDGADTLLGGEGNDRLQGGAGNDTLTGGAGHDTFVLEELGGSDVITDFSLVDSNGDGRPDDQIDVSGLTNGAGGPVTARDVVVSDDGFGNAKLTFPEGETLILRGVKPAQMSTAAMRFAAGIPCFTAGTRLRTPRGAVPVEALRPGDLVLTRDHGPQPVIWAAARHVSPVQLRAARQLRPVQVKARGRMLTVSPQHGILARVDGQERLVRAVHLARLGLAGLAPVVRGVSYVHLMFARHEIVWAEGVWSESFYPGPWGLAMLDPAAALSLARLLPDLARHGAARAYGSTARPVATFAQLRTARLERCDATRWPPPEKLRLIDAAARKDVPSAPEYRHFQPDSAVV